MIYNIQSKEDLDKHLSAATNKLVVLDFYATWCGPCKLIAPQLEELSTLYSKDVVVLKINVDDCEEIAMDYNVSSMPTFVFMKNHEIMDTIVGGDSENLTKAVEKYLPNDTRINTNNQAISLNQDEN
ncbi:thioredoxin-2-like [Musca vetustissima]|uniref:thioredoxin-2-like n=1 Tax=Musca vetustissima TaxID=27455 RepID=UPI002AB7B061|nr:thioredoxin-2-like [Musca vetustissima]